MNPSDLKLAGQMESLWAVTDSIWDDFKAILAGAPYECSSNDTRDECDRLAIPESARGALFRTAVAEGLLVKKMTVDGYFAQVPSTGRSAHGALIQIYLRRAL
jgi:hypothetical protein